MCGKYWGKWVIKAENENERNGRWKWRGNGAGGASQKTNQNHAQKTEAAFIFSQTEKRRKKRVWNEKNRKDAPVKRQIYQEKVYATTVYSKNEIIQVKNRKFVVIRKYITFSSRKKEEPSYFLLNWLF